MQNVAKRQSTIAIADLGNRRQVTILQPQKGSYADAKWFDSPWSTELLEHLAELKGPWFLDSYQRFEHPNYIQKQIDTVLELYQLDLSKGAVLDFGCGFGASTHCMIERGATHVVAADLVEANTAFASHFVEAMHADQARVDVVCGDIVEDLEPESFNVIWLQAVVEHLLPEERERYLRRFWAALRPQGVLVVTETPNRRWPIEGHTTGGTWFLPWMKPSTVFTRMRAKPRYQGFSDEDFYRSGIIGSSYGEILRYLGGADRCEQLSLGRSDQIALRYGKAKRRTFSRGVAVGALSVAEKLVCRYLHEPVTAYMPFLNYLAFRKI